MSNPNPVTTTASAIDLTATPAPIRFGLDAGMGALKLTGPCGNIQLPAHISLNNRGVAAALTGVKSKKLPMQVVTNGRSFFVGLNAHGFGSPVENMTFERLTGTPEMRALVYGMLAQYQHAHGAFGNAPIRMLIGLPIQPLSEGPEETKALRAAISSWLVGDHCWQVDGVEYTASIEAVPLTSQPVGAYYDWLLNENGKIVYGHGPLMAQETAVLSIGFNTIEVAVFKDNQMNQRLTMGQPIGVKRLLEVVNMSQGPFTRGELDTMLRDGSLSVKDSLPVWWSEVNNFIGEVWGDTLKRFSRVIVVGGGSILLKDHLDNRLKVAKKVHYPANLVHSIGDGLYKLLLNQEGQK